MQKEIGLSGKFVNDCKKTKRLNKLFSGEADICVFSFLFLLGKVSKVSEEENKERNKE